MSMRPEYRSLPQVDICLGRFTAEQKRDLILQSFMVASGSIDAHEYYVLYLSLKLDLPAEEASEFLRRSFASLHEELQQEIIQAADKRHPRTMTRVIEDEAARYPSVETSAMILALFKKNLPITLSDSVFAHVTEEIRAQIAALPLDFSPSMDSPVVKTLRQLAADEGAYDDKKWYQNGGALHFL